MEMWIGISKPPPECDEVDELVTVRLEDDVTPPRDVTPDDVDGELLVFDERMAGNQTAFRFGSSASIDHRSSEVWENK